MAILKKQIGSNGKATLLSLAGAVGSGLPIGALVSFNDDRNHIGFLECNGSYFDQNLYPELYLKLGSSNLPTIYDTNSLPESPSISWQNRADYIPRGTTYFGTVQAALSNYGLIENGFAADGLLRVETDDWNFLWLQDTDGTIKGYMMGERDNVNVSMTIPVKKGMKIYGWDRNGGASPSPSQTFSNWEYAKMDIWYYQRHKYIKATSGLTEPTATIVFDNIKDYVVSNTPLYTYDSATETLSITQRGL